jgi:predicted dehydrogenase
MHRGNLSRRGFLNQSMAALTIGAGLPAWYAGRVLAEDREDEARSRRLLGPNDEIVMAAIGVGPQGTYIMNKAMDRRGVRFVAVCDVDAARREKAASEVKKEQGGDCAVYGDFRELLARGGIDAVTIGTVDHWHALTAIAAMKAGCDVYCEKPLALTVPEGQAMVEAARKYDRVFQTGSMQRSDPRYRLACELVRNGRLGKVHTVEARIGENPIGGPFPEVEPPAALDWDFWKGPTPNVPYVKEKCHSTFRWFYEYSGGKMTDWGAHHNDIAQWALGTDDTGPVEVTATGQAPSDRPRSYNCHPHFAVNYRYADGTRLVTTSDGENGNLFLGERGWLFVNRRRIEASDPRMLEEPLPDGSMRLPVSNHHMANFLECVRSRSRPICDVSIGHHSVIVCHIGVIALRTGLPLRWNPADARFLGPHAAEANAMLSREMRSPWKLDA